MAEQPPQPREQKRKSPAQAAAEHAPYLPTDWTPADILSLQKLAAGIANAEEQKRALTWILKACEVNEQPFFPGGEDGRRATDFMLGKQQVGREISKLLKLQLSKLRGGEHGEHG